jgi:serine/threonine-protein kinase
MAERGRYTILKKIADGGMAEIFLAKQTGAEGFERLCILKRILPAYSADPQFRNMLLDEAHIAMSLHHSNIVPVLDLGRAEGRYFLVMDLVDGWDLGTVLKRARKAQVELPPGVALYIMAEVCRGLAYAHGRRSSEGAPLGIVHRDISPENVLLSDQGEIKVTDFGIAKALGKRHRTQSGVIKGKLDFMSPEQASGGDVDQSSDIFSLGALLYVLATGRPPFAADTDLDLLLKVQKADVTPPEDVAPRLPRGVSAIIRRAMQLKPSKRYASAEAMMAEVEDVLRRDFRSAGQSELKRWLDDLGGIDHSPPISRLAALPEIGGGGAKGGPPGSAVTLDLEDTSSVSAFAETKIATPVGTPRAGAVAEGGSAMTAPGGGEPFAGYEAGGGRGPARGRARRWIVGLAVVGAGAAAAYAFATPAARRRLRELRGWARARVDQVGGRAPARPGAEAPARRSGKVEPARGERAEARPQDESRREPPREPAARSAPAPAPDPDPDPRPTGTRRGEDRDRIMVQLASRPPGASVVGPAGSLGTTPLQVSMRPGATHVFTFAKAGYVAESRRVTARRPSTKVLVQLRRKSGRRSRR